MSTSSKSTNEGNGNTTTAGITYNSDGQRVIPATQREDGTVRKERKVRPGYTPAEDVARYQNRTAEAFRTRGSGGVPGAAPADDDKSAAGAGNTKNAKRRAARKKKAAAEGGGGGEEDVDEVEEKGEENGEEEKVQAPKEEVKTGNGPEVREREKQERNIRKKLAQARELQARRDKGETLLPEQIAKALKLQELVRELEKMGLQSPAVEP